MKKERVRYIRDQWIVYSELGNAYGVGDTIEEARENLDRLLSKEEGSQ